MFHKVNSLAWERQGLLTLGCVCVGVCVIPPKHIRVLDSVAPPPT